MDGLLLGYAQLQEDVFLLFCDSVVFCAFYSFPAHLLNKCNSCRAIGIKPKKLTPPFWAMDALGMVRVIVFGEESGILLAYLNLMNVNARPLLEGWQRGDGLLGNYVEDLRI